jgi:nucleoside-triphosphatase THEP1
LEPVWQRAAVLGSLWAASEIVLGSFLHNVRVPIAGHILTAIAVAILVAGHRSWRVPGLLWRAGLIAALMKSLSPSAVLLGPMVAIMMEGVLMEVSVRLLKGAVTGYVVGGALAMSWTLMHRIVSLLLTYGPDLARLYGDVVALAERQVGPIPLGPWGPLLALGVLNLGFGAGAALVGLRLGREGAAPIPGGGGARDAAEWRRRVGAARGPAVHPSLPYLVLWAAALPTGLLGLSRLSLGGKALVAGAAVMVGVGRYRRVLKRLGRPGFWASLVVITVLAGAVVASLAGEGTVSWIAGLGMGLGMSLNAIFVTMCFAALSTELSHPILRRWLERLGGGQVHRAVQAAFATLPAVVAALPAGKDFLRSPSRTLGGLLSGTERWLEALEAHLRILGVVTGERGAGKTRTVESVLETLAAEGLRVGGVLAPGAMRDGRRWSIDLVEPGPGRRTPMATRDPASPWPLLGTFKVNPAALELGRRALSPERAAAQDLVVVDEVGPWELAGEGWASALEALRASETPLLLVVRRDLLSDVLARFGAGSAPPIWDVARVGAEEIGRAILGELKR